MGIGILHPGAMGAAVAQTMVNGGHDVVWVSEGRSEATHVRAREAGLTAVSSLSNLVERVETIVTVCPPHAAVEVAEAVVAAGFSGIYLDANAVSPQKSRRIAEKIGAAGVAYVDGAIVGGPPAQPGTTWLHLSGPRAAEVGQLFAAGPLEVTLLGDEIGRASAVKMCFAARTKGTTALLTAILGAAAQMGVLDPLEEQWEKYNPGFAAQTRQRVSRTAQKKAWRFAGEMEEMAETFGEAGLPDGFFHAAAEIYRRVSAFKENPEPPDVETLTKTLY